MIEVIYFPQSPLFNSSQHPGGSVNFMHAIQNQISADMRKDQKSTLTKKNDNKCQNFPRKFANT